MNKTMGSGGLISMTGFAATRGEHGSWTWAAEVRSVNGRGLDLRFRLPDWVEGLEPELRKLFQAELARGNVSVSLRLTRDEGAAAARMNAEGLAAALRAISAIEAGAREAGVSLAPTTAADVAAMRGVLDFSDAREEDQEALRGALVASFAACLADFQKDRAREGAAIAGVISGQIDRIETLTADAGAAAGDREAAARAALERGLARILDVKDMPDEARLAQELALLAVKTDVTEELDRLRAHIAEARALLAQPGAVGRKFDFLMQEFNREANTLCSKSQSAPLTAIGLDLKALIDQMREQVQNIE